LSITGGSVIKTAEFEFPGYVLLKFTDDYVFYSGVKDYGVYRQPRLGFDGRETPAHVITCDSFCNTAVPSPSGDYVLIEQPNYVSLDQEIVRFEVHESIYHGLPTILFGWYEGMIQQEEDSFGGKLAEIFGWGNTAWSSEACPDTTFDLVGVKNPFMGEYVVVEDTQRRHRGKLRSIYVMNAEDGELSLLLKGLGGWTDYSQSREITGWFP
jgi:hypothetical protein